MLKKGAYLVLFILVFSLSIALVDAKAGTCRNPNGGNYCNGKSLASDCQCDASCSKFGDCCDDYKAVCEGQPASKDSKNYPPYGHFDGGNEVQGGWALDPNNPKEPVSVHFYVDGPAGDPSKFAGSTLASIPRPDVNKAFNVDGDHGFLFKIPDKYRDGNFHQIYAYAIDLDDKSGNSNTLLGGSPRNFSIIQEYVTCVFLGLHNGSAECYAKSNVVNSHEYGRCKAVGSPYWNASCETNVTGSRGTFLDWQSTCGRGNNFTRIDGVDETVFFDCSRYPSIGSGSISYDTFRYSKWQCYDGSWEKEGSDSSCKSSQDWKKQAEESCKGKCNLEKTKCGINTFSVDVPCDSTASKTSAKKTAAKDIDKASGSVTKKDVLAWIEKNCDESETQTCGVGFYATLLKGFDEKMLYDCTIQTPKYKAGRVFSNFKKPIVSEDLLTWLKKEGFHPKKVSDDKIDFDDYDENGKRIGTVDVVTEWTTTPDGSYAGNYWQWLPVASLGSPTGNVVSKIFANTDKEYWKD